MDCIRNITPDTLYLGASDRRLALFENAFPIPRGIAYNAYLVADEKTLLMDTADASVQDRFMEHLGRALSGRPLDYIAVTHMEPDHSATLMRVLERHPEATVICTGLAQEMMARFSPPGPERVRTVGEGETLSTGRHAFTFLMAPMVHWPEVMVVYDKFDKALYSSDAFGAFGALDGALFADEVDFNRDWLPDARRYYANIVGKYGPQVQALLKKAEGLDIRYVAPLHGPVWRKDFPAYLEKYRLWSSYTPEEKGVLIACGSIYGHTQAAAELLACELAARGVFNAALYDVSSTHPSTLLSEAFRLSHLVFASATYNAGIFSPMEAFLNEIAAHNLQNRDYALIENGSWAPTAGKLMAERLGRLKNMRQLAPTVTLRSALNDEQRESIGGMAERIAASLREEGAAAEEPPAGKRFVCTVCGYVYEGASLPEGFLCPLCKKDASYFREA